MAQTKKAAAKKTTAVAKAKPKTVTRSPRTYRAKVDKIYKEVLPMVMKDVDFALVPINKAKTKFSVEPTRDLNLMLVDYFKISYDTNLEKSEVRDGQTLYIVKATVWDPKGNKASGLGMASTKETYTSGRWEHDALAKAETRALKRAVEARCGFPIINKMIQHFFGGFVLNKDHLPIEAPQIENGGSNIAPQASASTGSKLNEVYDEIKQLLKDNPFSDQIKQAWQGAANKNLEAGNLTAMIALRNTVKVNANKIRRNA